MDLVLNVSEDASFRLRLFNDMDVDGDDVVMLQRREGRFFSNHLDWRGEFDRMEIANPIEPAPNEDLNHRVQVYGHGEWGIGRHGRIGGDVACRRLGRNRLVYQRDRNDRERSRSPQNRRNNRHRNRTRSRSDDDERRHQNNGRNRSPQLRQVERELRPRRNNDRRERSRSRSRSDDDESRNGRERSRSPQLRRSHSGDDESDDEGIVGRLRPRNNQ